jgi:ankyrin repeat protein
VFGNCFNEVLTMEDETVEKLCLNISSNNPSLEEVKKELEKISDRRRSKWGEHSPLVSAVKAKRKDLIKVMIKEFGFDPNSKRNQFPFSALAAAIINNDEDMVRFLVVEMKAKVNTNKCNTTFPSPLMYAVSHSHLQIVKLLVEELGADVNFKVSRNEDGSNPFLALHSAIYQIFLRLVLSSIAVMANYKYNPTIIVNLVMRLFSEKNSFLRQNEIQSVSYIYYCVQFP